MVYWPADFTSTAAGAGAVFLTAAFFVADFLAAFAGAAFFTGVDVAAVAAFAFCKRQRFLVAAMIRFMPSGLI